MRLVAALALLVGVTGCAAFSDDNPDGKVTVAAAFYPLAFVAERVGGDEVQVTNLTQPGQEPHDLSLSIRETAQIEDADLVLVQKGFQPPVDDAVEQVAAGRVLDVADIVDLKDSTENEGEKDPHFWQDPTLMAQLTEAVADELVEIDPAHAASYRANAEQLVGELDQLAADYERGLQDCERDTIVVSHDAFSYLDRFGLRVESIAGLSPDAEPTPADLAQLQELIRTEGITTVFSERLVSPRLAQALADDLGVETAVLDPIEGLSDQTADENYVSLMLANLAALEEANGCPA
jgi:zinc transport system substrate-binding protein